MFTFQDALDYLYSRLPMYQRIGKSAYKKDLTNTLALLKGMGNPELRFKTIHIAGTNGKGSSAHALAAILQLSGYKTGLYTSPHLKRFTERIKINGVEIGEDTVAEFVSTNKELIDSISPSFFEVTVAMAFDHFAKQKVDIAVIETGLGGRLDSTNVITPEVCLITNIGLDHTDLLGDTIEKIAREKAGIIKPSVPVVIGDMNPEAIDVMQEVAVLKSSPLILTKKGEDIIGENLPPYFQRNIPGIVAVVSEMRKMGWEISPSAEKDGLLNFAHITGLKGRYQKLQSDPLVIADVSHNPDGLKVLMQHVSAHLSGQLHVVFGTVIDKDLVPVFKELPKNACYYWTQSHVPRRLDVAILKEEVRAFGLVGDSFTNVNDAKKAALEKAAPTDMVLITGSTFVVAELDDII